MLFSGRIYHFGPWRSFQKLALSLHEESLLSERMESDADIGMMCQSRVKAALPSLRSYGLKPETEQILAVSVCCEQARLGK